MLRIGETGPLTNVTETNRYVMERHREAIERLLRREADVTGVDRYEDGEAAKRTEPTPIPSRESHVPVATRPRGKEGSADRPEGWPTVQVRGHTDLAVGGRKFSGNSQRRKRHWLLFHGTFLWQMDFGLVEAVLRPPSRQPAYRQARTHTGFLMNLDLPVPAIKQALQSVWNATEPRTSVPTERIARLVAEKYGTAEWNFKF